MGAVDFTDPGHHRLSAPLKLAEVDSLQTDYMFTLLKPLARNGLILRVEGGKTHCGLLSRQALHCYVHLDLMTQIL